MSLYTTVVSSSSAAPVGPTPSPTAAWSCDMNTYQCSQVDPSVGQYLDQATCAKYCSANPSPPPTTCTRDTDCPATSFCDANATCVPCTSSQYCSLICGWLPSGSCPDVPTLDPNLDKLRMTTRT